MKKNLHHLDEVCYKTQEQKNFDLFLIEDCFQYKRRQIKYMLENGIISFLKIQFLLSQFEKSITREKPAQCKMHGNVFWYKKKFGWR